MKRFLTATALSLLMTSPGLARENWAILVGASRYDNLDEKFWLKGPSNDMELVYGYLTSNPVMEFSPGNILLLADDVPGHPRATLQAIRDAFAEIAAKAQPGDFVYVHFAGHGTQAPALDPSRETDGLDELFLPVDIGPWEDEIGHVENALVDDEIGRMIDAIRAKGADVWAVFDSCHSGTVTRGAPAGDDEDVATRQLPPEALGIPDAAMAAAEAEAAETASRGMPDPRDRPEPPVDAAQAEGMGGFVYFYAAQTNEVTPEKRLPKGDPGRKPQGVFTFTIFKTLAERPGITYRQLAQEVLRKYSVFNLTRTTPMFEGDLDRAVFGAGEGAQILQWPAKPGGGTVSIDGGRLHGIEEGERLAVLLSPADGLDKAVGWVVAEKVDTFTTVARPVDGLDAGQIGKGAVIRKVGEALDYTLTIALPEGDGAAAAAMRAAAEALLADEDFARRIRFVAPGEEADITLAVIPESPRPDAIWMLPGTGLIEEARGQTLAEALASVPSVSTGDKDTAELAMVVGENLTKMARAINLMKLGAATGSDGLAVKTGLGLGRFDPDDEDFVAAGSKQAVEGANVPVVVPDDVLRAHVENTTDGPVDYNILYIGSDYSITWAGNGRLNPGEVLDQTVIRIEAKGYGRDRLVIVVTPAEAGTDTEDLSFLEQSEVERSRGFVTDVGAALFEAGFGETTRSGSALRRKDPADTRTPIIVQYEVETIPG